DQVRDRLFQDHALVVPTPRACPVSITIGQVRVRITRPAIARDYFLPTRLKAGQTAIFKSVALADRDPGAPRALAGSARRGVGEQSRREGGCNKSCAHETILVLSWPGFPAAPAIGAP